MEIPLYAYKLNHKHGKASTPCGSVVPLKKENPAFLRGPLRFCFCAIFFKGYSEWSLRRGFVSCSGT